MTLAVKTSLPGGARTRLLAAAEEKRMRGRVRRSLIDYCYFTLPRYQASWHHQLIAARLEEVAWGKIKRLIICAPPRHGKSELASVRFPSWYLGHRPQEAVIQASYTEALARELSRAARDTALSPNYQRLWPYKLELQADTNWMFAEKEDKRPNYTAVGVGGALAGKGGHLIIDDPIKNYQQAYSKVYRDTVWDWYRSTAYTRLPPAGWIVVMHTRWHEDDLVGRLLKHEPGTWTVVVLPSTNPEGQHGLQPYAALWPAQFNADALARIRATLGSGIYGALYEQDPRRAAGTVFQRGWLRPVARRDIAQLDELILVWDTAFEEGQENDFSVGKALGRWGERVIILDVWRDRVGWPDLLRAAKERPAALEAAWRTPVSRVLIEDKGSGISLRQALEADPEFRWPVFAAPTGNLSKRGRATRVSGYVEAGRVGYLEGAPWADDLLDELAEFDKGPFDDQVDALVHGLTYFFLGLGQKTTEMIMYEEPVELAAELAESDGYAPGGGFYEDAEVF